MSSEVLPSGSTLVSVVTPECCESTGPKASPSETVRLFAIVTFSALGELKAKPLRK